MYGRVVLKRETNGSYAAIPNDAANCRHLFGNTCNAGGATVHNQIFKRVEYNSVVLKSHVANSTWLFFLPLLT